RSNSSHLFEWEATAGHSMTEKQLIERIWYWRRKTNRRRFDPSKNFTLFEDWDKREPGWRRAERAICDYELARRHDRSVHMPPYRKAQNLIRELAEPLLENILTHYDFQPSTGIWRLSWQTT